MAFHVEIEPRAAQDLDDIAQYLRTTAGFDVSERWFHSMVAAIVSLNEMPFRNPSAPEAVEVDRDVRVLYHGRKNRAYKVYYTIASDTSHSGTVYVVHVRHWARKPISQDELDNLMDDLAEGSSL